MAQDAETARAEATRWREQCAEQASSFEQELAELRASNKELREKAHDRKNELTISRTQIDSLEKRNMVLENALNVGLHAAMKNQEYLTAIGKATQPVK